jgi:Cytochrome P450.
MFGIILIPFISAPALGLYFYFVQNFNFWKDLDVPYVNPVPFFGNLKACVLEEVNNGKHLKNIYVEHSDELYVGIFFSDNPSLLACNLELVKNILVTDFQNFMDRQISTDENTDPLWSRSIFVMKGERWRKIRTSSTPLFSTGKVKMMFFVVDVYGEELAACLEKTTVDGKFCQGEKMA